MTCKSVLIAGSIFLWGCSTPNDVEREAVTSPQPAPAPAVLQQEPRQERKVTLQDIADEAAWRRKAYDKLKQTN